MRRVALAVVVALALPAAASAHAPTTAIGRAVEALSQVDVSYDPGAAVSDVEAAGFGTLAGDGIAVAMLPTSALSEITGGPQAVASEVAREARLDGTLVALVGTRLAAVSEHMPAERLDDLMRQASAEPGSPAVRLERLTRAVRAEQPDTRDGTPWGWVAGGAAGLLLVGAVLARSRIREATP
jgi:hypothetical protein